MKRLMDMTGAVLGLLFTAPLLLLIAVAIKLTSAGPVLFRQERVGLHQQPFIMLKFRSMSVNQSDVQLLTQKNDPRVTGLGRWLRKTSLDELPQLWNVLNGEMSLVGPRPERTWVVKEVSQQLLPYQLRHQVKPGMTGWAQVNGWRGNTSLSLRLAHDLYYIEHWSVWLDVKIAIKTLWCGFIHTHAY